ncbi:condensin-2 complex subunit G2 [Pygocentrus nattereri]|uniref:Condensin-2 complex subunit G2 n=1 Tax=Pygocentrus nattereri TaxID=42514 RepID=A0A3B4EDP7_PYGNA|nr:condensin-2 complex subunit G2 [Pygocentrus nattereri]XP_037400988.1 condensin-2 complex subunit G2 [Pygocentrus nattereri]
MSKRKEFLDSVHPDKVQDFLNFIKLHKDGSEPLDLAELVQELQSNQRVELWGKLSTLLQHTLQAYPPERWITGLDGDSGDEMEVEVSAELKLTMAVLDGVTVVCTVSVDVIQDGDVYSALLDCAHMLNDIESSLPVSELPLQQAVHWLCECWWRRGLQGKEELGWTAFVVCLENTVTLKTSVRELNRLYSLKEVLLTVDFDSERGQYVTSPLLQCFLSTNHIKREEGKRFLAFLFGWDVNFITMIHETIKNQLQFFPKAVATDVAEIYFRAWKKASGLFLEEIESSCIQDFMQHALLLHRTSPVHPKVRQILTYFHKQKFRQGIDEMLHRLYKPILWKALKAANADVRANATLLFTEAFPVHDPGLSSEKVDELVQKQLDALFALLDDPRPLVRSSAVLGACSILARCWELLPSTVITDLLKKILLQLATDTSSPDVRCAVFICISVILDNSMSHPLMEKLLPALKTSLHDTSEKVRVAFVDLLLKIKAVRAAKFWKVCSMEHLLARLELDSPSVSKRIVNLLFNSFLPISQPEEIWCERCVTIIQMNPGAARKFYRYAYMYTAPTNIVKLMLMIRKCLNACIQKTGDTADESITSNKENTSVLEDVLSVKDTAVMASLLEIVVILWGSVQKSLEHNQEALQYTTAKFASVLPEYLRVFQEERCTAPLIRLAALLPAASVPALRSKVMAQLRRLSAGSAVTLYSQPIECVCSWGQVSHVLELMVEWLTEAAPLNPGEQSESVSRRVQFEDPSEAKPDLALNYLEYLLTRPRTRDCLLGLSLDQLTSLHSALGAWKAVLYSSLSECAASAAVTETALRAFSLHARLSIHLQHRYPDGRDFLGSLAHCMDWVEKRVLPFLAAPGDDVSEQQLTLGKQTVESCLTLCRDAVRVALGDADFNDHVLQLSSCVLLSEKGYTCVPLLLSVLSEVAQDSFSRNTEAQEEQLCVTLRIVTNIFQKVLEVMAHRLRKDKEEGQELCCSSEDALHDFLLVTQLASESSEVVSGVFSSLCAAVIIDTSRTLQKLSHPEEVMTPETARDLPPLSSTIITTILKSPAVTRCFLSETGSSVDSEAIDSIAGLAAVTHVLAVVRKTDKFKQDLKSIAVSVHKQILQHCSITAQDPAHTQRVIYENAVRTLNEVLMP